MGLYIVRAASFSSARMKGDEQEDSGQLDPTFFY